MATNEQSLGGMDAPVGTLVSLPAYLLHYLASRAPASTSAVEKGEAVSALVSACVLERYAEPARTWLDERRSPTRLYRVYIPGQLFLAIRGLPWTRREATVAEPYETIRAAFLVSCWDEESPTDDPGDSGGCSLALNWRCWVTLIAELVLALRLDRPGGMEDSPEGRALETVLHGLFTAMLSGSGDE